MNTSLIIASLMPIISFILFLLVLYLLSANKKEKMRFFNYFPFEFFGNSKGLFVFARIIEGFWLVSFIPLFLTLLDQIQLYSGTWFLFFVSFLLIAAFAILYLLLSIIPASKEKVHFALFVIASIVASTGLMIVIYEEFRLAEYLDTNKVGVYSLLIFATIFALLPVLLLFTPSLLEWYKLEKEVDEEGNISYKRPKVFILPFYEWLLALFASLSLLLIGLSYSLY